MKKVLEDKGTTRAQHRRKVMPDEVRQALEVLFTPKQVLRLTEAAVRQWVTVRELIAACSMDGVQQIEQMVTIRFGLWRGKAAGRRKDAWPNWFSACSGVLKAEEAAKVFSKRAHKEYLSGAWTEGIRFPGMPSPSDESSWLSFADKARAFGYDLVFVKIPEQTGYVADQTEKKLRRSARQIRKAAA